MTIAIRQCHALGNSALQEALDAAMHYYRFSSRECDVCRTLLEHPTAEWADVGELMGVTASTAKQTFGAAVRRAGTTVDAPQRALVLHLLSVGVGLMQERKAA